MYADTVKSNQLGCDIAKLGVSMLLQLLSLYTVIVSLNAALRLMMCHYSVCDMIISPLSHRMSLGSTWLVLLCCNCTVTVCFAQLWQVNQLVCLITTEPV